MKTNIAMTITNLISGVNNNERRYTQFSHPHSTID